jgi:hypothetical protein
MDNCNFCGKPLNEHPRTETGARNLTGCQAMFLLTRNADLEARLKECKSALRYLVVAADLEPGLKSSGLKSSIARANEFLNIDPAQHVHTFQGEGPVQTCFCGAQMLPSGWKVLG